MSAQSELLAEIETFLPIRGITETTFGRLAVNDGKFVGRLRDGRNLTVKTIELAREFIREETLKMEPERGRAATEAA